MQDRQRSLKLKSYKIVVRALINHEAVRTPPKDGVVRKRIIDSTEYFIKETTI